MPVFEIGLEDGRKLRVDAEDQNAALAGVQHFLGNTQQQSGGGVLDAAKQGASSLLSGVGETAQRYFGGGGQTLKDVGNQLAPQAKADTTLYDEKGFHPGNIPAALAESSPSVAAAITAARLMPGPIMLKLLAAGGVGLASAAGNFAKEATAKRTGDANAPSNTQDLLAGVTRAAPEAAIQSLPISRFLPAPAARLGLKGVVGSLGRTAVDAGAMGAAGAGANVYDQATQNGTVDPNQAIDALAKGAVTGGAFGAGRAAQDAKAAIKYRALAGEDPTHITEAANRIQQAGDNLDTNIASTKGGFDAFKSAQSDVTTEFKDAAKTIKSNNLSPEATNALARAQKGLPLGDQDISLLNRDTNNDPAVATLKRLSGVARVLQGVQETGRIDEGRGTFTGGVSGAMGAHIRALANPVGAAASMGLAGMGGAHLGDVFAHSPEALAALGGAYGLARFSDWASGNRSPANAFASRFADPSAGVPSQPVSPGLQALQQQAAAIGPTGPKLTQVQMPWGTAPPAPPNPTQTIRSAMPLIQKLAALGKPQQPAPPQTPQFNPVALAMLKQQLKNPPQAPQAPEPAPPEAPQMPQFNPIAMRMLKEQLANPPQAPTPPAPAPMLLKPRAPEPIDIPQFLPNRAENTPAIPAQSAAQALVPAISKLIKANGKVKETPAPAPKPEPTPPEDLSIPDFLKRTPAAVAAPQAQVAAQAAMKMNGKLPLNLAPDTLHTPEELAMSPKDYAQHILHKNYDEAYLASLKEKGVLDTYASSIERRAVWKRDTATTLSQMFPEVAPQILHTLMGTNYSAPIRKLRDALAHNHPDKAAIVNDMLSNKKLEAIWKKVNPKK